MKNIASPFVIFIFNTLLLFLSFPSSVSAQNWYPVYENSADGKTLQGSLVNLKKAIKNGADIKVMLIGDSVTGTHIIYPDMVGITNNGELVYAKYDIHSLDVKPTGPSLIEATQSGNILISNGKRETLVYHTNGTYLTRYNLQARMKWFAHQ